MNQVHLKTMQPISAECKLYLSTFLVFDLTSSILETSKSCINLNYIFRTCVFVNGHISNDLYGKFHTKIHNILFIRKYLLLLFLTLKIVSRRFRHYNV